MPFLARLLYLAYSAGMQIVTWLLLVPWVLVRVFCGRTSWSELSQRLGHIRLDRAKTGPRVLIHAVSVGEMVAADVLIGALARAVPGIQVILTSGNRHGLEAGRRIRLKRPQVEEVLLLPWDRRTPLRTWVKNLRLDLVAIVETELWPNLFISCGRLGIPLCLVNGRIYPRDVRAYCLARRFFKPALDSVSRLWVQSEAERGRFCRIGADPAKICVAANLKFDAALELGTLINMSLARTPVIVAGSTHPREEEWIIQACNNLRGDFPWLLLVIAPRQPQRTRSICSSACLRGLSVTRFSRIADRRIDSDVLILDRIGALNSFYQVADVAIIGGSLTNCGGHNLLEPAARACSIVMGPHYEHFQDIVDDFRRADAIVLLSDRRELSTALRRLLDDSLLRRELGCRARATLESRAGTADQYARWMAELLSA